MASPNEIIPNIPCLYVIPSYIYLYLAILKLKPYPLQGPSSASPMQSKGTIIKYITLLIIGKYMHTDIIYNMANLKYFL